MPNELMRNSGDNTCIGVSDQMLILICLGWASFICPTLVIAQAPIFERTARRKLLYLNQARVLADLKVPPGNHLEALSGNRSGQYSIRVNDQWRICFQWSAAGPSAVEIVDYH